MANTNTDLTEEDAADLQFPKDAGISRSHCVNCYYELDPPFVVCHECDAVLCTSCFASGAEVARHRNSHDYYIANDNFILFRNSNWSAQEELILLNALLDYGNFNSVAKQLPNRSVKEVKDHYDHFYLLQNGSKLLPTFPQAHSFKGFEKVTPFRCRLSDIEEPPRYSSNSMNFHTVAGYNPARSDFELEYDASAEDLVSNLVYVQADDPHYELLTNLQCAIFRSYNRRLLERQRRKAIIRDHGLILIRNVISKMHRYNNTITKQVYERMCRFLQFCTGVQFDYLMEGLHRAGELKIEMQRLQEFRNKGITTKEGAKLYVKLKRQRDEGKQELKAFKSAIKLKPYKTTHLGATTNEGKKRGVFTPLDVMGLPGYEKLTLKEQEVCRNVRLVPLSYLEFKKILMGECRKAGHLKLQTARRMLKIDVNKTRKLYDFLVEEGYINKD